MKWVFLIIQWYSIAVLGYAQSQQKNVETEHSKLDVKISVEGTPIEAKPIILRCEMHNFSDSTIKIKFFEFIKGHGKLTYATCISALVMDSSWKTLCENGNWALVWSSVFKDRDMRYIKIKPGRSIIRKLDICQTPIGCTCKLKDGWEKGKYRLQVWVAIYPSNVLDLEIN